MGFYTDPLAGSASFAVYLHLLLDPTASYGPVIWRLCILGPVCSPAWSSIPDVYWAAPRFPTDQIHSEPGLEST